MSAAAASSALEAALTPLNSNDATRVASFLDRLSALSAREWLAIGREVESHVAHQESFETAGAIVEAIIADRKLEVTAWYVRDVVETIAYLASRFPGWQGDDSEYFTAAQVAAERAVLALLVVSSLPRAEFDVLFAPVAAYVRPAEFCPNL